MSMDDVWEVWDGDEFITYVYTLDEAHAYYEAGFNVIKVQP
jgi:hypothetical protein